MNDAFGNALSFRYELLLPEIILAITAALVIGADAFRSELRLGRRILPWLSVLGLLVAGGVSLLWIDESSDFQLLLTIDNFTTFFRVLFIATAVFVILGSHEYVEKHIGHIGEFYALILLSTVGAIYMAAARELLTAYVSIEILSFSLYVAVSLARNDRRSGEAALKYALLGGVASAMLLYGLSLLYGVGGSTQYAEIGAALAGGAPGMTLPLLLGLALIIAGLGFKASAVPFHMYTPDVYEGAPLPITAYIAATSKAAVLALFLRWFSGPLLPAIDDWQWMIVGLSLASMALGNLIALQQHNIKRLLAYSSIGQVGFMLMAIATISEVSASALLLHIGGYLITNLAVFTAVIALYNRTGTEEISGFRGLAQTNPYLALVITAGLFSLAGMPMLAGFLTKFILFQSASQGGYLWLVTFAVMMSVLSLYYYLKVIREMYLHQPDGDPSRWRLTPTGYLATGVLSLGMVVVGVYAAPLYTMADRASRVLF
ncbi:MAG: NADH-quinone oxidoreductase subunit N [Chloroflexi bacterium]|nr:NADH-quinone oxidoreductase subunit N [Chloroflexota bacterium]MDA1002052.1 NADH-quinone oxidoreductase subunit N [Chloroflexota bacterium]MQC27561.1 NADH-quinone oxidoreductase subunit N [Chloroflexota bacterium]